MKIVCDACQAKYSISDDKVQGKVFKIRCKKCSNIIVVRGGASAAEAAAPSQEKETRTYDYGYDGGDGGAAAGDDAVWHVVINQDQVGPMTAAAVQQRFAAGEIDADTYIWREGFSDWMPISQVDTFAGFVASGSQTASVGGGGSAAVAAMFGAGPGASDEAGTVRSDPGDLFATASSSARASDDDGDLFGSKPSKSQPAAGGAASKLRGERNENSVLFSLGNLAQLASDKPAPVTAAPSASTGHATGAAGGEGSGLIDIRSMASAYLGGGGAAAAKPASAIGSIDDLPVFGGGGFSEPAVIVPTAARQQNSKLVYALIGSVGLLAVAAIILVVVMLKGDKPTTAASKVAVADTDKDKDKEPTKDQGTPTTGGAASGSSDKPADGSANPGSAAASTDKPADDPADTTEKPTDKPKDKPADKPAVAPKPKDKPTTVASRTVDRPKDKPAEKPVESKDQAGCDEVSCVLNNYEGACCSKFKKGKSTTGSKPATTGGGGDMPESLDRAMISDGVNKVKARVMACGDKSSAKGQVKVSVKVNPDGSVANVTVKNTPDPKLGDCVASAMQKASFKRTQNGGSFGYPFVF